MAFEHLQGTEDDDVLEPTNFSDRSGTLIEGLGGNDEIYGGAGNDELRGGDGNDSLSARHYQGSGFDKLYGGAGDDFLQMYFEGGDYLNGGSGNDTYWVRWKDYRNITIEDESGVDTLTGPAFYQGHFALPSAIENLTIDMGSFGKMEGTDADNAISLTAAAHWGHSYMQLYGYGGDDVLKASLYFQPHTAQTEFGGRVYGGDGDDRIYSYGYGEVVDDLARTNGKAEHMLYGEAGNDTLKGGNGDDRLDGGVGDDVCYGGTENDYILGGAGHDLLSGDAGDDHLVGGRDDDKLEGGRGADRFSFSGNFGRDRILDFSASEGDVVELTGIFTGFADLMSHAAQAGDNVRITASSTQVIVLKGVEAGDLEAGNFLFS